MFENFTIDILHYLKFILIVKFSNITPLPLMILWGGLKTETGTNWGGPKTETGNFLLHFPLTFRIWGGSMKYF